VNSLQIKRHQRFNNLEQDKIIVRNSIRVLLRIKWKRIQLVNSNSKLLKRH